MTTAATQTRLVLVDPERLPRLARTLLRASVSAELAAVWADRQACEVSWEGCSEPPVRPVVPEVRLPSLEDFLRS